MLGAGITPWRIADLSGGAILEVTVEPAGPPPEPGTAGQFDFSDQTESGLLLLSGLM
jgi:hypothetical protein